MVAVMKLKSINRFKDKIVNRITTKKSQIKKIQVIFKSMLCLNLKSLHQIQNFLKT